ncbi:peptide-methionine (S)-S-oxide reductase MsrA [bacterium]|nr:peptide-methionine (S)-S-oxide reductase MsrA [bacterium]
MTTDRQEQATFGGGCFWCLEAALNELKGITSVVSGYAGGQKENPTYQEVCTGRTGHAEVVQITYDPTVITYRDLLGVFFTLHDPTSLNRQGADVGTQYRSVIFPHSPEQEAIAREMMAALTASHVYEAPIVTTIEPLVHFYPAEEYHQNYFARNPEQPYCQLVVAGKVAKVRAAFFERLKRA